MASLANHVTVSVTRDTVGITRAGFGTLLLLSPYAAFAERVRSYNDLAGVAVDFPVTTSPEYIAASVYFSQAPKPTTLKIGRQALKHTQVYTMSIATVRNSHTYKIGVKIKGAADATAEYTSDGTATDGEIVVGLVAALNAVTGNNYIAAGITSPFTVTADAAGDCFALDADPDDTGILDITSAQTHADAGIATDLTAIAVEDPDWFALYTFQNSNAVSLAAAAWCETNEKLYANDVSDTNVLAGGVGNSDTIDDHATLLRAYTFANYHRDAFSMFGAGWCGAVLPILPGGETWKFKTVVGVVPVNLTATQRSYLVAKNGNSYESVAGGSMTYEGTTADGDFIDVTRFIVWIKDDAAKAQLEVLRALPKVPFTNVGIGLLKGAAWGTAKRGVRRGGFSDDPGPTVTAPKVEDVSVADKAARTLPDLKIAGTLAGAVHKVNLSVVISL